MTARTTPTLALALAALAGACADPSAPVTVRLAVGDDPPAYGEAPFPTDAVRGAGGAIESLPGLDLRIARHADVVADHIAALGGFGLRPAVEFFLDGPLDPATLPALSEDAGAAAVVLDVDPSSPERGRVVAYEWRYDPERQVIVGAPRPGEILREGTRHAAVLTAALADETGRRLGPAPELERLRRRRDLPARWLDTAETLAALEQAAPGGGEPGIVALTVFTTQQATAPLLAARDLLADPEAVPPPALRFPDPDLVFDSPEALERLLGAPTRFEDGPRAGQERWGWSNPTGIAHESVGVIATGVVTMARFRREGPEGTSPEDRTFVLDPETGAPEVLAPAEPIPITFVLPAAPAPGDGYPVVLFGHGLGNSRHAILTFAEPLTRAGYAVVAIDFHGHGSRWRADDRRNNTASLVEDFTGDPDLADGFGDQTGLPTTYAFFEGLMNFSAVRDSVRQSALDLSQLTQLLRSDSLDLGPLAGAYLGDAPRLDARRIAYLGESYGTIVGVPFAAIEPHVDLFVLNVPGAGIIDLSVVESPDLSSLAVPTSAALYGVSGHIDRFHTAVSLIQAILDGADPLTYARHVLDERFTVAGQPLGPRHVVAIEVVGDEVIPNVATDALARALGLEVVAPALAVPEGLSEIAAPAAGNRGGQTAVMLQSAPATHGANWASEVGEIQFQPGFPHPGDDPFPRLAEPLEIENPIYETLELVIDILDSHRAAGTPVVRSGLGAR